MNIDKIAIIKDKLTMRDVLARYGFEPKKGFICCPFHSEKTPSMKIHDTWFYCFGCGEKGDIIAFVQKLFGLSCSESLKKIDGDFSLGLYGQLAFEEMRRTHYAAVARKAKADRERAEKQHIEDEYWAAYNEYWRLKDNKEQYAPKSSSEELHPLYVEALQKLAYQEYLLECAEIRRYKK